MRTASIVTAFASCFFASFALADDWTNAGGNAGRNGLTDEVGPTAGTQLWSGGRSSIIAWQPVTAGHRVFMVRQLAFVPTMTPNEAPVVAQDLDTGAELWTFNIPYNNGDWTTWVAGCSNGRVYASRAGNGNSIAAKLYALDQATGAVVWASQQTIKTGAYDGVVFADDGDPICAEFQSIKRIDAATGATVWTAARQASVSGNCGAVRFGNAVYVCDSVAGGVAIKRYDAATGAFQYKGPTMAGFTVQNTPMVGPDGTIYMSRVQNNVTVDFFFAFADNGTAITSKWNVPAAYSTSSEFAVGPDGSVYMLSPGNVIARLDPTNGATLNTSVQIFTGFPTPRIAVDFEGKVYVSSGGAPGGTVFSFNPDLTTRWSVSVANVNIGAPALGADGTLVIAGIGTNVKAYRTQSPWTDLGFGIAGVSGVPALEGKGSMTPGLTVALRLEGAASAAPALLVVGSSGANLPFFGGTLVPFPDIVIGPFGLDAEGGFVLGTPWPANIPSGVGLWFQTAVLDAAAVQGVALSNAVFGLTP